MRYFIIKDDEYIYAVGNGTMGEEISEEMYHAVLNTLESKPQDTEYTEYLLTVDLTWEAHAKEPQPEEETAEEVLAILTGESE